MSSRVIRVLIERPLILPKISLCAGIPTVETHSLMLVYYAVEIVRSLIINKLFNTFDFRFNSDKIDDNT